MKHFPELAVIDRSSQPPSGGCVLKQNGAANIYTGPLPAAFRRLCVETNTRYSYSEKNYSQPPSGGCVLKLLLVFPAVAPVLPAAFRRLCVET